ncbi:MAG: nucleotide exchange factor GrpE, partial [Planctomycetota bacterium]
MKTKPTDKNTDLPAPSGARQAGETPAKSAPAAHTGEPRPDVSGRETRTGSDELPKTCAMPGEDSAIELQKLQKEIEALRKAASERDEFLKLLQRVQADFLNYQKRIKSERECWDKYQDENLLRELLPAFDNFGRTLKLECTTDEAKCIMDGVTLIKREIFRILEKRGLKQMKTVGEKFDPNLHEAVAVT